MDVIIKIGGTDMLRKKRKQPWLLGFFTYKCVSMIHMAFVAVSEYYIHQGSSLVTLV